MRELFSWKKNFPGRAYVFQIDDPSYNICKELTNILNPLDEGGASYIRDTYHFKETIKDIQLQEKDIMGILDIVGMFPNVPVRKTLEIARDKLEKDETLASRTKWKVDDIIKLLEISIETYFKTIDCKIYFREMVCPLVNRYQNLWQGFTCIGLKSITYLMRRMSSSQFTGKGRWMIFS